MGVVVDPFARCRNPLAWRDSGGVADDRDQIAMATGLCPQNAEAVLAIMEGDTLDKARQYFLGRWFLLWPQLCCRCWRQSPNRIWRPALRSRSSSATQCPRVLSIGDRPLVGNRPAIQILGSRRNDGAYLSWLQQAHKGAHGNADLVAHFFRRAFDLLRDGGAFQAGDKFKPGPKWHILQFPAGCLRLLQSFSQLG